MSFAWKGFHSFGGGFSPSFGPSLTGGITPIGSWDASTSTLAQLAALVSHSRTSLATMFDSTGKLTYAPNNLLTQSNNFASVSWTKVTATITSGVSDPLGGTNAFTVTANAVNAQVYQGVPFTGAGSVNFIQAIWVKRRTGSGTVSIYTPNGLTKTPIAVNGSWQLFYTAGAGNAGNAAYNTVFLNVSGDEVDIYAATLSAVTYETTPRTDDQVITTASAYYGPRIDYDPNTLAVKGLLIEEARTNLLVNSKSDGTNLATQNVTVTAQPYTLTFYGTGSVTLSGASTSGPLSGSGAFPTRSTLTFTPSAGTLTLTVAGTVQYAQLEAGSFATSYIPTFASSVTRAADVVQFTGAALAALQGSAGSAIVELQSQGINTAINQRIIAGGQNLIYNQGGTNVVTTSNGTNTLTTANALTWSNYNRAAVAWNASGRSIVSNGSTVASVAFLVNNSGISYLGSLTGSSAFMSGWYKSFAIYNQRLPDATLQARSVVGASY